MSRRVHLLWLTVPLAAWLGYRASPLPAPPARQLAEASPLPPPLPLGEAATAIDTGLENATPAELKRRLASIVALPDSEDRYTVLQLLCARWAEVDPHAGLAFIATLPGDTSRLRGLVLTEWALLNSEAAWAYVKALGPAGAQDQQMVTASLLNEDPAIFFQWFRRNPSGIYFDATNPAWLAVARANFSELEAIASRNLAVAPADEWNSAGQDSSAMFGILAAVLVEKDPKGAFEWAESLPKRVQASAVGNALAALCKTDCPGAAAELARLCRDKPDLAAAVTIYDNLGLGMKVTRLIGKEDPGLVLDLMRKNPRLGAYSVVGDLYGDAIASGRMEALDAFRALADDGKDGTIGPNILPAMWGRLSTSQLHEASHSLATEPDSKAKSAALQGIFGAMYKRDPQAALTFAGGLPDATQRQEMYSTLLWERPTSRNHDAARQVEILQQIPEADRAATLAKALTRQGEWVITYDAIAQQDPQPEKLAAVAENLPPSPDLDRAVTAITLAWGQTDPLAAMKWVAGLQDPAARNVGLASALRGWAIHDSYGASMWLSAQPPGKFRDAASLPLINQLKDTEPASAWKWANAISDVQLRQSTCTETFAAWAQEDPSAAAEALDAATGTLSDNQIADLRKTLPSL